MEDIKIKRLKELLKEKGWTQKKLGDECGYTPQYINYLLKGTRNIVDENAKVLGKVLNVDPAYILGKTDYKSNGDYWMQSLTYHTQVETKFIDLLGSLEINLSIEEKFIERRTIIKDLDFNEIENTQDGLSQLYKLTTPQGEKYMTELEFHNFKEKVVKTILEYTK